MLLKRAYSYNYILWFWTKEYWLHLTGLHVKCGMWYLWVPVSYAWWRHQMEIFSALLNICAGNSPDSGEFPAQRPATWSFGVSFDLCLNKRLSKQSRGWWFETLHRPLWRHCNDIRDLDLDPISMITSWHIKNSIRFAGHFLGTPQVTSCERWIPLTMARYTGS